MADVTVKFLGDKTQLSKAVGNIKEESKGIGASFSKGAASLKSMALPALGAAAAVFKLAQNAGETAGRLFELQEQTGVSTDKLQEMSFVANQVGVDQEFYAESLREVLNEYEEFREGTGTAAEGLEMLGVSARNASGELKSGEEITDDAIAALLGIEDATKRAALAEDIFKGASEKLLPVLGLGEQGFDDMRAAAHELGAVQSGEALTNANDYRQGMEELQVAVQDLVNDLLQVLLPAITDWIIPALEWMIDVVGRVEQGWRNLYDVIFGKMDDLHKIKQNIGEVNIELGKTAEFGRIAGGGIRTSFDEAKGAIKSAADELRKATDPAFALRKAQENYATAQSKVNQLEKDGKTNTQEYTGALADELEVLADLNYAREQYEAAGLIAEEGLFNLGEQAGRARDEVDQLIASLEYLGQVPVELQFGIDIGVDTYTPGGAGPFAERDTIRNVARELGIFGAGGRRVQ